MGFKHNYIFYLVCLVFQLISSYSYGQLCEGNSSEVLFTEPFGSGENFGPELAEGITTYNYGDIGNGNYVVTNTTGLNGSLWHNSPDHTPGDIDGYMLLFDASESPGTFYQNTFANLCNNTEYVFSCYVANIVTFIGCSGFSIEPNLRFRILDPTTNQELAFVDTGEIPTSSELVWTEFAVSFKTLNNQDDIKIEVINNANGGCGNDLAIDDFSLRRCDPVEEITENLCESETGVIQIGNFTFFEPGNYEFEVEIENSCNTKLVKLTIEGEKVVKENSITNFCTGDTIISNGFQIYQDTIILDTLIGQTDCVLLNRYEFISNEPSFTSETIYLCNDEEVQIGNTWYSETESIIELYITDIGCDSTVAIDIIKTDIEIDRNEVPNSLEIGDEVQLLANTSIVNLDQLFWDPAQGVSCIRCLEPLYTPSSLGTFTLSIIDSISQCSDSINFLVEPCASKVYLPNAFSPNSDRINDTFSMISNDCIQKINSIKIFDRWGGLIHEGTNLQSSGILWDGYSDNKISRTGVYVYLIEAAVVGGVTQLISGDISLII